MKVKCVNTVQNKHTGKWYTPGNEYEVTDERGKELVASKYFVAVEKKAKKEQ